MSTKRPKSAKKTVKETAQDIAKAAKTKAKAKVKTAQSSVADRAESEADSLRRAGSEFDQNPLAQQAAHHLSENLSHAAGIVRDADFTRLQQDQTGFARKNAAVFWRRSCAWVRGRPRGESLRAGGAARIC